MNIEGYITLAIIFLIIIATLLGYRINIEFKNFKIKLEKQKTEIDNQQEQINFLVQYSMSKELFEHLLAMKNGNHFEFHKNQGFISRLEYLIFNNYIYNLRLNEYKDKENIHKDIVITKKGEDYIKLRDDINNKQ